MVRFGAFEFDAETRRLRRDGADIHLSPKAFYLLTLLLEAAPRVVSKRELHEKLWVGGAVADATLVALIKQLRGALDDHDRQAPLIRTVHRVGYALEARLTRRERGSPGAMARWLMTGQRRLPLVVGENIVGRDAGVQVRLDDPSVSRLHARIVVNGSGALLQDLGSKNGTFFDGRRLATTAVPLRDGSQLAFGTMLATYSESGGGIPTQTHFGTE
jgi:DNA-binding winged helix-turn-helix (wHTH) protein